jgi:dipeptidyl-peptidase-3
LKWLLLDGDGFMRVEADVASNTLLVHVDRDRIISHGKPSLGRMLLRLHMYRCTANAEVCREYYEDLSRVDGDYSTWRDIVVSKKEPKWKFVQANTFLSNGSVSVKEYEATNEGIIQSWAERHV